MAAFDYKPTFSKTHNEEIKQLQDAIRVLVQKLSIVLRDVGTDNLSQEVLAMLEANTGKDEIQAIKGQTPNAYIGNDGQIYKILSE